MDHIIDQVSQYRSLYVIVTGREPLSQPYCLTLLKRLRDLDYVVSSETSGALSVVAADTRVIKVIDIKTPALKKWGAMI